MAERATHIDFHCGDTVFGQMRGQACGAVDVGDVLGKRRVGKRLSGVDSLLQ
ncbi:hypothetical protein GZH49_34635 [Nocardia terpenica]|uniref:hypothetical protein n=1 Tax=Nocardia terpenica TaxID=455432 RepID=UPI002FE25AEE